MTNLITEYNDHKITVSINGNKVIIGDNSFTINYGPPFQITDGNNNCVIIDDIIHLEGGVIRIELLNHTIDIKVENPFAMAMSDQVAKGKIVSPMAGIISNINVKAGDFVSKGATLLLISAMKMENKISSPIDGKITAVHVNTEDQVTSHQLLIEIEEDS